MVEAIIAIIMAIVSFFASKKSGASDGEAAVIAAGAGLGTYYVATETEWGKGAVSSIKGWIGLDGPDGEPLLNDDSSPATAPEGAEPVLDEAGNVVRDENGKVLWKLVDSTGKVLTSWGAAGTAGVIATGAAADGGLFDSENMPWIIGGGVLALLLISGS